MKLKLRNNILSLPSAKIVNETQIVMRCPICGDSKKDPNKARFNIKLNINDDEPIIFHCFNCEEAGFLTPSILRTMRINDLQLNSGLITYNNKTMGLVNKTLGIKNNDFNFVIPNPTDNLSTKSKLKYIQNRLGIKFSIQELIDLRTVFHLGQFLKENDIQTLTVSKEKAKFLHDNYVGFLTTKNEFINFRDTTEKYKRWDKYSIYKNLDNTRKFYTLPNDIDLLTSKKITLNIAEGVFDILGIYYHLYNKEQKNMIYTAVCGSGYISVLKYFIKMGVFGNIVINIFSDKDKVPSFYIELQEELKYWVDEINLFYNELDKDFGVTKDKIKLIKKKIKI